MVRVRWSYHVFAMMLSAALVGCANDAFAQSYVVVNPFSNGDTSGDPSTSFDSEIIQGPSVAAGIIMNSPALFTNGNTAIWMTPNEVFYGNFGSAPSRILADFGPGHAYVMYHNADKTGELMTASQLRGTADGSPLKVVAAVCSTSEKSAGRNFSQTLARLGVSNRTIGTTKGYIFVIGNMLNKKQVTIGGENLNQIAVNPSQALRISQNGQEITGIRAITEIPKTVIVSNADLAGSSLGSTLPGEASVVDTVAPNLRSSTTAAQTNAYVLASIKNYASLGAKMGTCFGAGIAGSLIGSAVSNSLGLGEQAEHYVSSASGFATGTGATWASLLGRTKLTQLAGTTGPLFLGATLAMDPKRVAYLQRIAETNSQINERIRQDRQAVRIYNEQLRQESEGMGFFAGAYYRWTNYKSQPQYIPTYY